MLALIGLKFFIAKSRQVEVFIFFDFFEIILFICLVKSISVGFLGNNIQTSFEINVGGDPRSVMINGVPQASDSKSTDEKPSSYK